MQFSKYFAGERVKLHSPLSAKVAAERINAETGSPFWPLSIGVVGRVWSGHVRLRLSSSIIEYNMKPVLTGRLQDFAGGSQFDLVYRAPAGAIVFSIAYYGFLAFVGLGAIANNWNPELTSGDIAMIIAIYIALLIAPIGLHFFGTRHSDSELLDLIDFLSVHADASPVNLDLRAPRA